MKIDISSQNANLRQPAPVQKRWLTPAEAAQHLNCSKNFLDKNRTTRICQIPFTRLGRLIRYDVFDLDAHLETAKVTPAAVR